MVKTSVYLPDELHAPLKRVARQRGASEAELIRQAIRREVADPGASDADARRARLLALAGAIDDDETYPSGYLDDLRKGWR